MGRACMFTKMLFNIVSALNATSQPGAWFRLQKFTPSVRTDPWAPVRGLN
jgi:hypothetical protein